MTKIYSPFIFLMLMLLVLASCNEKISPDLKQGSNTTDNNDDDDDSAEDLPPIKFGIKNISDETLGFYMHEAGPGNSEEPCEISVCDAEEEGCTDDQFKHTNFTRSGAFDKTCIIEAEEFALYLNGVKMGLDASAKACDVVSFTPYYFYQYKPGVTVDSIEKHSCAGGTIDEAAIEADLGITCSTVARTATPTVPIALPGSQTFSSFAPQDLCHFNHSSKYDVDVGAPDCDEGEITINENAYSWNGATTVISTTTSIVDCDGSLIACINGPGKDFIEEANFENGVRTVITELKGKDLKEYEYSIDSPFSKDQLTNMYVANFRRGLVGVLEPTDDNFQVFDDIFNVDIPNGNLVFPRIMESYSQNSLFLNTANLESNLTNTVVTDIFDAGFDAAFNERLNGSATLNAYPYAVDPHVGLGRSDALPSGSETFFETKPFYTFTCLNNARDVRARIRVMVREWDRMFTPDEKVFVSKGNRTTSIPRVDLISDSYFSTCPVPYSCSDARNSAKMHHLPWEDQGGDYFELNDIKSWDDQIQYTQVCDSIIPTYCYREPTDGFAAESLFPGPGL